MDNDAQRIYDEQVRPELFGYVGSDNQRSGPLTACVVFGPTGSGKQNVGMRATQLLQSQSLATVTIRHSSLLAHHPGADSADQGNVDRDINAWRDSAIAEAAQRGLGVVVEAPLSSEHEAQALLDSLHRQGYRSIAFAVCAAASNSEQCTHPQRQERAQSSQSELPWIAEAVENHPSVVRMSLVDRHCRSLRSTGSITESVEQAQALLAREDRCMTPVSRSSSTSSRSSPRR